MSSEKPVRVNNTPSRTKKARMDIANKLGFVEVKSAHGRKIVWYYAKNPNNFENYISFFQSLKIDLVDSLKSIIAISPIKFNLKLEATYNQPHVDNFSQNRSFETSASPIFIDSDINDNSSFNEESVNYADSSYIKLPPSLINNLSGRQSTYKIMIIIVLNGPVTGPNKHRVGENYYQHEQKYNFSGLTFPTPWSEVKMFERNNLGMSVNVYGVKKISLEHSHVYPIKVVDDEKANHFDIILYSDFGLVFGMDNILNLNQGKIQGSIFKSRNGREFQAFQGIPYAKPPIGDLRLQDPEKANSWSGILDATKEKPMCIQKNLFMYETYNTLLGAEDCLYMNVYTPKVNKKNENDLLPVMVWIPGGGFSSGHGGFSLYGPQYLLDKDVVVASFNYRIGPLGFLSTEDDVLPGNYGMKDQVLALEWVKSNIEKFGGDPNKVTIFGESAGSVSVGLHLLSPMSKGLFHKAILESGTPLCRWAVSPPGWAKRRAAALAT
ncbi:Carboxylic ester hydrolase, partial [Aphis craccivora]